MIIYFKIIKILTDHVRIFAYSSLLVFFFIEQFINTTQAPINLLMSYEQRFVISEPIRQLLKTRFPQKHEFWGSLLNYNKNDIESIIDVIFPTIQGKYRKERSMLYDKDKLSAENDQYNEEHKDWPDSSYIWEPPANQKVGKDVINGMRDIQHIIFDHQHPKKCENKKFAILSSQFTGLGSQYHLTGVGLGMALDQDRIAVWDKKESYLWNAGPFCENTGLDGHDCFFEPLSNCSLDNNISAQQYEKYGSYENHFVPMKIMPILNKLMIPKYLWYFYWRLSAITYLIRYNNRTKIWLEEFEKEFLSNPGNEYDISIHIRHHQEKAAEMDIIDFADYYKACKIIEKLLNKEKLNVFLSSEDPNSIVWFKNNTNYSISYFNYSIDGGDMISLIPLGADLSRRMLSNLRHSVFSKYVIGTMGSNWNRVINEIRMTSAGYANELYFEVGDHTCLSVEHCKFTGQEFHMNW